jgi:hypothetical protein
MDCGSIYESSILSGHPMLKKGVRLVESRQSLKLASGVRFAHPLPLAAGGAPSGPGGAPRSERGGSRFEAWAASQFLRVSFKGQNATNVQIEVRLLIPVPRFRPVVQSHRTQRSER